MTIPEVREIVVLLLAAGLVGPVAHRLRVSPVLGFLIVGVVIGPFGLGRLTDEAPWLHAVIIAEPDAVHIAAELGVIFLLFMIGLELSLTRLWRMRGLVFGLGGAQVVVTACLIGAVALQFGNTAEASIVLGAGLALSSTAIVTQLLTEKGRLGTPVGRASFSVLLFQDLAVVPVLFLVGILGAPSETAKSAFEIAAGIGLALGRAALAIGGIIIVGRLILRPLLRLVAEAGSREFFLAAILLAILGTAEVMEAAGLSRVLGAFLAGLLFGETEYRHQVAVDLEPFKGLLLGVFFVSVGLGLDLATVAAEPIWLPLSVAGLIAIKALVIYVLARAVGEPRAVAAETALLLGQGGEFAFIVIALAVSLGVVGTPTAQFMSIVVGLTMLVTPILAMIGRAIGQRLEPGAMDLQGTPQIDDGLSDYVVIAGYGRVGRAVGELLDKQKIAHVAVDFRAERVTKLRASGIPVHFGDASQRDILVRLNAARAAALVVTMDQPQTVLQVVESARRDWPNLPIYARVRDESHARALLDAGANHVTLETTEASLQLGEAVLVGSGVPGETARILVAELREATRARFARGRDV